MSLCVVGVFLLVANAKAAPPFAPARMAPLEPASPSPLENRPPVREAVSPERKSSTRASERWSLLLEGVANAPLDVGVRAGVETPERLRFSGGFGYMPVEWLTSLAASTSDDRDASLVLELPSYSGTVWRAQVGVRPFPRSGFYLDVGYARATLRGSVNLSESAAAREEGLEGSYLVRSALHLWLVEIGHEWRVARRGVIGFGAGMVSTFDASTSITALDGAPTSSRFPRGAERANDALEKYGTIPVLTLRLGVDLI